MNYPPRQIKIGNSTFNVSGYGRFGPGLCFAYNDEKCLLYPEDGNLFRQGYRLAEISGADGAEITGGSSLQDLSYTFINDKGDEQTFKRNDSVQRRGIEPDDLLFIDGGEPIPTGLNPGAQNADDTAIQKHQDKDLYTINPFNVLDLISFSIDSMCEFDGDQLRLDLMNNEKIGYVLGPTTMLLDLAPDDFERIFEGEYLPKGITCDLRARQHTILFECSGKTEEIRGKARFIPTPQKIQELYTGEIRNRLNIQSLKQNDSANDAKADTQTPDAQADADSSEQARSQAADPKGQLRYLLNEPGQREEELTERRCILVAAAITMEGRKHNYRDELAELLFEDDPQRMNKLKRCENKLTNLGFDKEKCSEKWSELYNSFPGNKIQKLVKKLDFLRAP